MEGRDGAWWRDAVVYEVYVRSFADADGDGIGDLAGVRDRLPYLQALGVDALWFTPWYDSPWIDGGYDVADYRRIHPDFGTLDDARRLIDAATAVGIRVIVDVVPNHVSAEHRWFKDALLAPPGSPERDRFWFRDGRTAPNGWTSSFDGGTWTRTDTVDGAAGQWYLHLFDPGQPDLNWNNAEVRREFEDVLRFWFDLGVAGVRIDSAALLMKDPALPEVDSVPRHPFLDRDENHEIYRSWRAVADEYGDRALVGEVWLADMDRFTQYLRMDEMHTAFNFDFMTRPWDAISLRASILETLEAHAKVDAPPTWVLSNHDITRPVTRYGREESAFSFDTKRSGIATDLRLGTQRARAAALLTAALPGVLYVYQGDELGLPEVEDLPDALRRDPMFLRSGGRDPGREGCRVPLPWAASGASFGFGPRDAPSRPWLPQPADWGGLSVEVESGDPTSMLELYRAALRERRSFREEGFEWIEAPAQVIAFRRGGVHCVANLSDRVVPLPADVDLILTSAPVGEDGLPPDTAAWYRSAPTPDLHPSH